MSDLNPYPQIRKLVTQFQLELLQYQQKITQQEKELQEVLDRVPEMELKEWRSTREELRTQPFDVLPKMDSIRTQACKVIQEAKYSQDTYLREHYPAPDQGHNIRIKLYAFRHPECPGDTGSRSYHYLTSTVDPIWMEYSKIEVYQGYGGTSIGVTDHEGKKTSLEGPLMMLALKLRDRLSSEARKRGMGPLKKTDPAQEKEVELTLTDQWD